jgi:hypothetical protein
MPSLMGYHRRGRLSTRECDGVRPKRRIPLFLYCERNEALVSEGGWEGRVRSVVAAITDGSTASPGQLCGLSEDVIRLIESDQPARLAGAYRLFLQLIGGGAGFFLRGSDVYYPKMLDLKEAACDLLSENESPFVLEDSDRVFLMHQGYCFDFLRGSGPDPEVWSYSEGSSAGTVPERTFGRFTDWLRGNAEREIPVWARHSAEIRQGTIVVRKNLDGSITEHHHARNDW